MIVQRHSLKPKTNWNFKLLFRIAIWSDYEYHKTFKFLACVFPNSTRTLHCNIMADKGLTLFDE